MKKIAIGSLVISGAAALAAIVAYRRRSRWF